MNQLTTAERLAALGLSVIPVDHPSDPIASEPEQVGKVPAIPWKAFQVSRPGADNLRAWFGNGYAADRERCPVIPPERSRQPDQLAIA